MQTETEYLAEVKRLQEKHKLELDTLAKEYAFDHAVYKVGDILKDSQCDSIILVDTLKWSRAYLHPNLPVTYYHGYELKKDLTPIKDKNRTSVYNLKSIKKIN